MLRRTRPPGITIRFDGAAVPARIGESAAAALIAAGVVVTRRTPGGAARGPYCMMGACFECLATVDDRASVQLCMTIVQDGMRIETQEPPGQSPPGQAPGWQDPA